MLTPRNWLFGTLLLFVSLYLPVMSLVYSGSWSYTLNCTFHQRCEMKGMKHIERYADNLTGFFRHQNTLKGTWTQKERYHLAQVRGIYDWLLPVLGLALVIIFITGRRANREKAAIVNTAVLSLPLLVLPWFGVFWKEGFHGILFDNLAWKNTTEEVSWYLTPRIYFRNAMIYIVCWALLINLAVYAQSQRRRLMQPAC